MGPFAAISTQRTVWTVDARGRRVNHAAPDLPLLWAQWTVQEAASAAFSWPTWAPTGDRVAAFRLPDAKHRTAAVFVLDADGVRATELGGLSGRLPIYLHWSEDAEHLAVLSQGEGGLHLSTLAPAQLGHEVELAQGSPLFFTWAGPGRVAAFVGDADAGSRLALLAASGRGPDEILPGLPGNFCAPLWVGAEIVFVDTAEGRPRIVAASPGAWAARPLESIDGLVAMVAGPDGRTLARAHAPGGDATPYRRLGLVDVPTGEVRELADLACLSFFWSPAGDALIVARVDTDRNLVEWLRLDVETGELDPIADLYPSRDLGFYLRFFEQYTQSHPLVDPSGRTLLLAGSLLGHTAAQDPARIWAVDIATGRAEDVGEGVFAVWAPPVGGGGG